MAPTENCRPARAERETRVVVIVLGIRMKEGDGVVVVVASDMVITVCGKADIKGCSSDEKRDAVYFKFC